MSNGGGDRRTIITEKAARDPEFRSRLLADASSALAEAGLAPPANIKFNVVEDTADTVNIVLPAAASEGPLSDEELAKLSGGAHHYDVDNNWV